MDSDLFAVFKAFLDVFVLVLCLSELVSSPVKSFLDYCKLYCIRFESAVQRQFTDFLVHKPE